MANHHIGRFFSRMFAETTAFGSRSFRYGFLVLLLGLLVLDALTPSRHYFGSLVVPLMLLCNHLAFQFRWPKLPTVILRIVALSWCAIGILYCIHLLLENR